MRARQNASARSVTGIAAVLTAVVLWGVQLPVASLAFVRVDPYHVTAIRYGVAAAVLLPVLVYMEGTSALRYGRRFWLTVAVGIVGMCLSPMLSFVGLSYSQPEHAAVISALQPLMVAIAQRVLRGRTLPSFTLACIVLAFAGVLIVVTEGKPIRLVSLGQLVGDLLIFGGAIAWVTFAMARERFSDWSTLSFTTLTMLPGLAATLCIVALAAATGVVPPLGSSDVAAVWPQLLYLSFGSALIAMVCWNAGNQRIGALDAMLLINLQPVVTFTVRFFQGYRYTPLELAGAVLVVAALFANALFLRARSKDAVPATSPSGPA